MGLLPRQSNRDGEAEDPPSRDRGPAPSSGSRKHRAGLASPETPNSVILEAPQDGGEDGGRGVSGLFQGGGGGGAGPRRVTASASGRPPVPEGGAPYAGWLGLTDHAGACEEGGRDRPGLSPALQPP